VTKPRGFAALSLDTISDGRLPHNALRVLAVMSSYSNGEDKSSVSNKQIAQHLDIPHNIVGQFKGLLHQLGYVQEVEAAELDSEAVYLLSKAPSVPTGGPGARKVKHRSRGHPDAFKRWYAYYPRKSARGAAELAYSRARKLADEDTLLIAVKGYADLVKSKGVEKHFIPFPATWLNQQRWSDDDLQSVVNVPSKSQDLAPETL
jgi:hypothetical protein